MPWLAARAALAEAETVLGRLDAAVTATTEEAERWQAGTTAAHAPARAEAKAVLAEYQADLDALTAEQAGARAVVDQCQAACEHTSHALEHAILVAVHVGRGFADPLGSQVGQATEAYTSRLVRDWPARLLAHATGQATCTPGELERLQSALVATIREAGYWPALARIAVEHTDHERAQAAFTADLLDASAEVHAARGLPPPVTMSPMPVEQRTVEIGGQQFTVEDQGLAAQPGAVTFSTFGEPGGAP
jgi:hypothetical protein